MASTSSLLFTIILPSYNVEDCIGQALASLQRQRFSDFEVLVMDGKSTDGTLAVVNSFAANDTRIRCISAQDAGIYDAMNKGVATARGNWFYFLGADDVLHDERALEKIAAAIGQNRQARLVYGNVRLNKPLGYHYQNLVYAGEFTGERLLSLNLCHQSAFYHRSLFETFGTFRTRYPLFADYDFNLRCFNRVQSVFVDCIVANFFVGGRSKDQQSADRWFEKDFLKNMVLVYPYHYRHPYFSGRIRDLLGLWQHNPTSFGPKGLLRLAQIVGYQTYRKLVHRPRVRLAQRN